MVSGERFRRTLFRNFATAQIIFAVLVVLGLIFGSRALYSQVAAELTSRAIAEMNIDLAAFLTPVRQVADVSYQLGRSGKLDPTKPTDLDATFSALIDAAPQISSIHVAQKTGYEYMLLQQADGKFYNRISDPDSPGTMIERRWLGVESASADHQDTVSPSDYDARERVWFRAALAALDRQNGTSSPADLLVWSDPYTFFTTGEPGITASVAFRNATGGEAVVAFDVLLKDILGFVKKVRVAKSGFVFVLLRERADDDLVVLALPDNNDTGDEGKFPYSVRELRGPPRDLLDAAFGGGELSVERSLRFRSKGENWWGAMARSTLSDQKELWIASAVPESEVLAALPNVVRAVIAALTLFVGLVIWRANRIATRLSEPIAGLVARTERMGRLNFTESGDLASPILEINALAQAQEVMRRSLQGLSKMNDRMALAHEMRRQLPDALMHCAEAVEVSVHDRPEPEDGGVFPVLLPACVRAGGWQIGKGDTMNGTLALIVETTLEDRRAADVLQQTKAFIQGLLNVSCRAQAIFDEAIDFIRERSGARATIGLTVVFVDHSDHAVQILSGAGAVVLLRRGHGARRIEAETLGGGDSAAKTRIDLRAGDIGVVFPGQFQTVLDADNIPLSVEFLSETMTGYDGDGGRDLATWLAERIEGFRRNAHRERDVPFIVFRAKDDL